MKWTCRTLSYLALSFSLVACTGNLEATGDDDAPGADGGTGSGARANFTSNVEPIFTARCNACHKTSSPKFSANYDDLTAYRTGANAKLLACTAQGALLYTKGSHAGGGGPAFTTDEATKVAAFIDAWADEQSECSNTTPTGKAATAKQLLQAGANTVDLSNLGPGLAGAKLTFNATATSAGLVLTEVVLTAGTNGLHVKKPRFETCPSGTAVPSPDQYADIDVTLAASATQALEGSSITGAKVAGAYALRFDTITPSAGSQGNPVDNGGSCQ